MGSKGAPPPDYGPLAAASAEAASIQAGLGRDQLAFAREQYDRTAPLLERITNQQMAAQDEQMAQARDYYNYQQDTYRPLERGLVADAQRFNTEAYRNDLAARAAADVGVAFGQTQAMNQRAMSAMGVNPNSGRFAGMQQATGIAQAATRANAMTGARTQADQMGYARKLDAAGLGRGLAGASLGAYGGATAAGSQAGLNAQSAGQNYMGNMAVGAGTIAQGQKMQLGGLSSVLNAQTQTYINSNDSPLGDLGALMGGAASLAKAGGFAALSDRRLKENVVEVGVDQRTALTLYEFNYKKEVGDPNIRYRGVMADEVELVYPEAVGEYNGFKTVHYAMLGIEMKEVA
tara:strand:+ start:486 stop:1526 length:1041 start_codon:yes stop_codon:yes gene_type:complete